MIDVKQVLCPIDFSDFSSRALAHAAALARWYEARLTALYVCANVPTFDVIPSLQQYSPPPASLMEAGRLGLEGEMRRFCARAAGNVPVTTIVQEAPNIEKEILAQIDSLGAELLVIGSHGRSGFQRLLLGSVLRHQRQRGPHVVLGPARDHTSPHHVGGADLGRRQASGRHCNADVAVGDHAHHASRVVDDRMPRWRADLVRRPSDAAWIVPDDARCAAAGRRPFERVPAGAVAVIEKLSGGTHFSAKRAPAPAPVTMRLAAGYSAGLRVSESSTPQPATRKYR